MMSGMMGKMNMIVQMNELMESRNKMMQSQNHGASGRPNEQWRQDAPEPYEMPEKDG